MRADNPTDVISHRRKKNCRAKKVVLAVIPIATETMAGVLDVDRAPSKTSHDTRWIDLDRQSNDTFKRFFNGWQMMVAAMVV